MSFFDEYPAYPPRAPATSCCDQLSELDRVEQFLHVLGHSRVPFSTAQIAALSDMEIVEVRGAISAALRRQWIAEVEPESYMNGPTGLYVGLLAKRR